MLLPINASCSLCSRVFKVKKENGMEYRKNINRVLRTQVLVIGGGAAGMMAAAAAAQNGCRPVIYEKNEKLGKKIYITGKGRPDLGRP